MCKSSSSCHHWLSWDSKASLVIAPTVLSFIYPHFQCARCLGGVLPRIKSFASFHCSGCKKRIEKPHQCFSVKKCPLWQCLCCAFWSSCILDNMIGCIALQFAADLHKLMLVAKKTSPHFPKGCTVCIWRSTALWVVVLAKCSVAL